MLTDRLKMALEPLKQLDHTEAERLAVALWRKLPLLERVAMTLRMRAEDHALAEEAALVDRRDERIEAEFSRLVATLGTKKTTCRPKRRTCGAKA